MADNLNPIPGANLVEGRLASLSAGGSGELLHSEGLSSLTDVKETIYSEPKQHIEPEAAREVPLEYGDTKLVLLVRDPEWVYGYWEINDATREQFKLARTGHSMRMVIRLYKTTGRNWPTEAAHYFFDVEISPFASNWYIKVPEVSQDWCGELGFYDPQGTYVAVCRSNPFSTPRDFVSDDVDSDWMTVEENFQKIVTLSAGGMSIREMERHGSEMLVRTLNRILHPANRDGRSALSFFGGGALGGSSSGQAFSSHSAPPTSPGGPSASVDAAGKKSFWLQVHTELILHGATEPDAQVTVQGIPVKLSPDGTFTLRFSLPEGIQNLPVHAVNADGDMEREITPVVTRETR